MYGPSGQTLVDIFIPHLESKAELSLASALLYKRYAGDIMMVALSIEQAQNILGKLGFVHHSISLNFEG